MQALQYRVVLGSTLCKLCKLCSTATCFVQALSLQYKVVLRRAVCKLCSTKQYQEAVCASFVVQSSTGTCFVQALKYNLVLRRALCKLCLRSAKSYWDVLCASFEGGCQEVVCASFVVQSNTGSALCIPLTISTTKRVNTCLIPSPVSWRLQAKKNGPVHQFLQ